jgi:hypothetical protein
LDGGDYGKSGGLKMEIKMERTRPQEGTGENEMEVWHVDSREGSKKLFLFPYIL